MCFSAYKQCSLKPHISVLKLEQRGIACSLASHTKNCHHQSYANDQHQQTHNIVLDHK